MIHKLAKVHPEDNVLVALVNLEEGETVSYNGTDFTLPARVPAKHKFVTVDLEAGDEVKMYGVLVGKAQKPIQKGGVITTSNLKHAANGFEIRDRQVSWTPPDVSKFRGKTFNGFHRADGKVGTANYWLVVPLVFCENRNIEVLKDALVGELGYGKTESYKALAKQMINA
jgi:altronate hydrolase